MILTSEASSEDANYAGMNADDVEVTNQNDDVTQVRVVEVRMSPLDVDRIDIVFSEPMDFPD